MEQAIAPFRFYITTLSSVADTIRVFSEKTPDLVFLDYRLGQESGLTLIEPLLKENPDCYIVMMTAHASFDVAIEAMKLGAKDFLRKPFSLEEIELLTRRVSETLKLKSRISELEEEYGEGQILLDSKNPKVQEILKLAKRAAQSNSVVLITGESGSGKTELAKAIHHWSNRSDHPFATVACPTLSAELLESELFGHVKGAFTGAIANHQGRIAKCEGGTLFLDEVGTLPLSLQPKLLRFLQDFTYERVGDTTTHKADVRIITATNANLADLVTQGQFREDLYYRVQVVELRLPALRERPEDIEALAQLLLFKLCKKHGRSPIRLTQAQIHLLKELPWRGNIRELHNTLERALIFSVDGEPLDFKNISPLSLSREPESTVQVGGPYTLEEIERAHIEATMARIDSVEEVAQVLGINPSTLWRKRKGYEQATPTSSASGNLMN
ncbi:MAG: sigma-54-dependent Fis family transcriptional regulator [Proteobacteria bacterium]|nr:sigma-54-dependent Fis family transcriptional regulator [Pseudomonadota bacterium]